MCFVYHLNIISFELVISVSDISTNISRVFHSLIVSGEHKPSLDINTGGFVSGAWLETLL